MGRPTKLTPEIQQRIVNAVAAGNYYEAAAAYGGVTYYTFNNWMKWGEEAKSGIYFNFFHAVIAAEAQAEVSIVAQWKSAIPENWQAGRDFLARRHPDRWGPKERRDLTVSGNPAKPLTFLNYPPPKPADGTPDEGDDADA